MHTSPDDRPDIPPELRKQAKTLAGELAWHTEYAAKVVAWAFEASLVIAGVELWHAANGSPKWIASSNYQYSSAAPSERVRLSIDGALAFISKFGSDPEALFNLTWDILEN